jgi:hypothetical protein
MGLAIGLAILVVLAIPLAISISRANELFCIEVDAGKPRFVRGRIPQRLLSEITDVVRRPRVERAKIRVVTEDGHPRVVLDAGNVSEGQMQQLRNVVGTFRVAEIRAGKRPR